MHAFLINLANRQTDGHTKKHGQKHVPPPVCRGSKTTPTAKPDRNLRNPHSPDANNGRCSQCWVDYSCISRRSNEKVISGRMWFRCRCSLATTDGREQDFVRLRLSQVATTSVLSGYLDSFATACWYGVAVWLGRTFYRAMLFYMLSQYIYVTRRHCVETAKQIIELMSWRPERDY